MADTTSKILIFGCGNMGGAMLRGWIAGGVAARRFVVVDPVANGLPEGVALHRLASDIDETFDTVVVGIKPQMIGELAPHIVTLPNPEALVISILAGTGTGTLSQYFPHAKIVRLMPNLAAAIGKSPLGLFSRDLDSAAQSALEKLLEPLGTAIWLDDERQMDAVTALAGSGPAFVYRFVDALARGGVEAGLPQDVAAKLALKMVEGAALLAASSDENPDQLADRVTSPGGTTAAGLAILDANNALNNCVAATLLAATQRGTELAKGE